MINEQPPAANPPITSPSAGRARVGGQRWALTGAALAIGWAVLWGLAVWRPFMFVGDLWWISLDRGCISLRTMRLASFDGGTHQAGHARQAFAELRGFRTRMAADWWVPDVEGQLGRRRFGLHWPDRTVRLQQTHPHYTVWIDVHETHLPLWIPVMLAALPTLLPMARRRASTVDHCAECGYDLRGNPGARCPECGTFPVIAEPVGSPRRPG